MASSRPFVRPLFAVLLCAVCAVGHAEERDVRATRDTDNAKRIDAEAMPARVGVPEDTTIELPLGEIRVVVPMPKRYVRMSDAIPEYMVALQKGLPREMRLIEILARDRDVDLALDDLSGDVSFEFYATVQFERSPLSPEQWRRLVVDVTSTLKTADLQGMVGTHVERLNESLSDFADTTVRFDLRDFERPALYHSDDRTIRVIAAVSTTQNFGDLSVEVEQVRVTAMIRVRDRVLTVIASKEFEPGKADIEQVRRRLEACVEAILRANPASESGRALGMR